MTRLRRGTRSRSASTRRTRARSCRRPAASIGCASPQRRCASTPGVEEGDEVGTSYDPMIAKLIASGATRDEALDRLAGTPRPRSTGVTTNLPFLRWLVAHPALRAGEMTTAFLVEYPPLSAPPAALPDQVGRGAFQLDQQRAARDTITFLDVDGSTAASYGASSGVSIFIASSTTSGSPRLDC